MSIKEIREAIREDCSSQHDMDSAEIDRCFTGSPVFSGFGTVFQAETAKAGILVPHKKIWKKVTPQFFLQGCGFFHALRNERSEVNGRFSALNEPGIIP